jgi:hypothetical protein
MFWSRRRRALEQQLAEARQEIQWLTDSRAEVIAELFAHA